MKGRWLNKAKPLMIGVIVFAFVLTLTVNFTGLLTLESVEVNGAPIDNWAEQYDVLRPVPICRQPLDSLARLVLQENRVHRVDISLSLPDKVRIATNHFDPICFVLDRSGGRTLAIDRNARVVPIPQDNSDWERPVITGVDVGRRFGRCADERVPVLVPQIERLMSENFDLYCLIDEINLTRKNYVSVGVSGLNYSLRVRTDVFFDDLARFSKFVTRFSPDLEKAEYLDFTHEDIIVQRSRKG